jgi:prepilin-type N-terminal cleavage/methylation domain-containing protein
MVYNENMGTIIYRMCTQRGFTLIELLIVIAIVSILAVVVVLVLNPSELLRQSRDSSRISDLTNLKHAILLYLTDNPSGTLASSTINYGACYLSTVSGNGTTSLNCGMFTNTYAAAASTTKVLYKKIDSTGWIPIDFRLSIGAPLGNLPADPINNAQYYYAYAATTTGGKFFEIDASLESQKYSFNGSKDVESTDGGNSTGTFEAGNIPALSL